MNIAPVFVLVAFVLALLEAIQFKPQGRVHWGWMAMTVYFASVLVGYARLL